MGNVIERDYGRKYRTETDIVAHILAFLRDEGLQTKTHVMYDARLSFPQLRAYLGKVLNAGLVEKTDDKHYSITKKGLEFLSAAEHVNALLQVKA